MSELTSWERVHLALHHQEPDRVPTAIGGGPYGLVDPVYFQLLERLQLGSPVTPFRTGHNISYQDDRLLERLGTDFRYVYPGASPSSPTRETDDPEAFLDGFGQVWKRALPYYYADRGMLSDATTLAQIDEIVQWPDPGDPQWTAGVAGRARALRETTRCWIAARMVTSHGPFQTACDLRGTENLLVDFVENEAFALHLLDRVAETLTGLLRGYLAACGPNIDMIELPGDDYAGNASLIISPAMFRKFIRPALEKMVRAVRDFRPDLKIMFHSDGAIRKLIPDLIEIGVDAIHPLEPLPGQDLAGIKAEFGDRVSFIGGIDIRTALPGPRQEVIAEVQRRIRQLAPGGGYILAPANHLQADVPAENVLALFQAAREMGKYPIAKFDLTPVDASSPLPRYYQVYADLSRIIHSGSLKPGDLLPPEIELARAYKVGRQTVRSAIARLVNENVLDRYAGIGTILRAQADRKKFYLDRSFTQQMAEMGMQARSKVLKISFGVIETGCPETLQRKPGAPCLQIVRLRYGDDLPIGLQSTTILTEFCPGLESFDFNTRSLYEVLSSEYQLQIAEIAHLVSAVAADEFQAERLQTEQGAPLLLVRTTAYLPNHEPIEATTSHYRADRYEFSITHSLPES